VRPPEPPQARKPTAKGNVARHRPPKTSTRSIGLCAIRTGAQRSEKTVPALLIFAVHSGSDCRL